MSCNHRLCRGVIERPKLISTQAPAWSDYKHHNRFKFLVGIHPLGLFRSSVLVIGVEHVTNLSPEILSFVIY